MSNNHCLHLNLLGSTTKYFLRNRLLPPLFCLLKRVYVTMITLHYFVNMLVCCNLLSLILAMVPPAPKPVESCCFYSIFSQLGPIIETITCTFAAYIQAQTPLAVCSRLLLVANGKCTKLFYKRPCFKPHPGLSIVFQISNANI